MYTRVKFRTSAGALEQGRGLPQLFQRARKVTAGVRSIRQIVRQLAFELSIGNRACEQERFGVEPDATLVTGR